MQTTATGPVFLICGGGRTGSTMVERLLVSTRQVLVWGEHGGILIRQLRALMEGMQTWMRVKARGQFARFLKEGYNAWIPNMNPEPVAFSAACRAFLETSLGQPARALGYPRWGFKEIKYGKPAILFLQELYPDAGFIFLIRNPLDCLKSIKSTGWYPSDYGASPETFLNEWTRITVDLLDLENQCPNAALVRYEDLLTKPEECLLRIAKAVGIAPEAFDRAMFESKERGTTKAPVALTDEDWQAVETTKLADVAKRAGYEIR